MKSDKRRIFINSIIVTSANIIDKFLFIVINIVIARYLSKADFGEYTTALGFASFFAIFANVGINEALVRAVNLEYDLESEHFGNTLFTKTVLAIFVYACMVLSLFFTPYNRNTILLTLLLGIVRIGSEYLSAFYALYNAKEQFRISSIFIISFALSLLSGTVLVVLQKGNYFHLVNVRLFLVVIFIILILVLTLKNFRIRFDKKTVKGFILNAIPFGLFIIYFNFIQRSNIIILSLMHGTVHSGIFNNGFLFFISLAFIQTSFHRVILPFLYKVPFNENRNKYQFTYDIFTKFFCFMSFYLILVFFLYSDKIIIGIFGEKYRESIEVLKIVSLGLPFLFNVAPIILIALERQKKNTQLVGFAALISIFTNIFFIYFLKSNGAAISAVITFFSLFLFTHSYLKKNAYIFVRNVIYYYLTFIIITVTCIVVNYYFVRDWYWISGFIFSSVLFLLLTVVIHIRSDDRRIIKEILGFNK